MIFRQLFDRVSFTYTYLLASEESRQALIIDPVLERVDRYLQLLEELDVRLMKVIDTHVHADHISGMGALRDRTRCVTVMGQESSVDVVSLRVSDGDLVGIEGIALTALYTPGHTSDSYSFAMQDRVFTGDALFIRGTGRTDFQLGSSIDAYYSLFEKLLQLPDATLVYPGHDYKGDTVSTIGEERAYNPRLQVKSAEEYAELMANLNLANPKMMDVAVPANMKIGLSQEALEGQGLSISSEEAEQLHIQGGAVFVDLREALERKEYGSISGAFHVPYGELDTSLAPGGSLHDLALRENTKIIAYCAYGERSAMTVQRAKEQGIDSILNLKGGIDAWRSAGCPIEVDAGHMIDE